MSQSTEQLCDRVAQAAESALVQQQHQQHQGPMPPPQSTAPPKMRGSTMTLSRKTQKALSGGGGGGTWGSISRVFARQKKRTPLDASLYDGGWRLILSFRFQYFKLFQSSCIIKRYQYMIHVILVYTEDTFPIVIEELFQLHVFLTTLFLF